MTEILVRHTTRGRLYVRRFDHYEAAQRYAAGETQTALAREFGVTQRAVSNAIHNLDPGWRRTITEYRRALRTTVCEVCGGPATKPVGGKRAHNRDGRILCHRCRSRERREAVRVAADGTVESVLCFTCRVWKRPDEFARGSRYRDLRDGGFHPTCRPCGTRLRTEYRARNKVPCEGGCGRLVEGAGRPNTRVDRRGRRIPLPPDRPYLCRSCAAGGTAMSYQMT